jgi:hypothetical protein
MNQWGIQPGLFSSRQKPPRTEVPRLIAKVRFNGLQPFLSRLETTFAIRLRIHSEAA